jgi:hypothetical protein
MYSGKVVDCLLVARSASTVAWAVDSGRVACFGMSECTVREEGKERQAEKHPDV